MFGIVGRSGAGKSTLLRLINGLETPSGGDVLVDGVAISTLDATGLRAQRRRIGMIFQHFNLLQSRTVAENIAFPLRLNAAISKRQVEKRVDELLDRVGLRASADHRPSQLSGGQKQRVGIARALACEPKILLCDEATSALDPETTASVLALIGEINHEFGITIALITHEMDVVRRVCDRVAVLDAGHVVESGTVADVFLHPQHPTTRRFVEEYQHDGGMTPSSDVARVAGRRIRVTLQGDAVASPVFSQIARDTQLDFALLAGRVDRIKGAAYAQLTLAISGGDVDAAADRLRAAGARIEDVS